MNRPDTTELRLSAQAVRAGMNSGQGDDAAGYLEEAADFIDALGEPELETLRELSDGATSGVWYPPAPFPSGMPSEDVIYASHAGPPPDPLRDDSPDPPEGWVAHDAMVEAWHEQAEGVCDQTVCSHDVAADQWFAAAAVNYVRSRLRRGAGF